MVWVVGGLVAAMVVGLLVCGLMHTASFADRAEEAEEAPGQGEVCFHPRWIR